MYNLIPELSETDNAKINDFLVNGNEEDISSAIDFICTSCLPNNDPTFLAFYNKQLDRLNNKRLLKEDIEYLKQLPEYERKKAEYDNFITLRPALSTDYESKKTSSSPLKSVDCYYISDSYKSIVGEKFIALEDLKKLLRDPSMKTALKEPVEPTIAKINLSNVDLIKSLNMSHLKYILQLLIQNIDSSDLELVKGSMILIIAHHCVTDSSHHKKTERSSTTRELSELNLKKHYDELYNTYLKSKQN